MSADALKLDGHKTNGDETMKLSQILGTMALIARDGAAVQEQIRGGQPVSAAIAAASPDLKEAIGRFAATAFPDDVHEEVGRISETAAEKILAKAIFAPDHPLTDEEREWIERSR
jgi:hypothetical protein